MARLSSVSEQQTDPPRSVRYRDSGRGSAVPGEDYRPLKPGFINVEGGASKWSFPVVVLPNAKRKGARTVVVELYDPVGVDLGQSVAEVAIVPKDRTATDSYGSVVVEVEASDEPISVGYQDSGEGTAVEGEDYAPIEPGTLTFPPGATKQVIDVKVLNRAFGKEGRYISIAFHDPVGALEFSVRPTGALANRPARPGQDWGI